MAFNTTAYVEAFLTFRRSLQQAVDWTNVNWNNRAITRERFKRVMDARATLLSLIPSESKADPNAGIADVLAKLAPKTGDESVLQEAEWRKVQAMIDAGRSLEKLILEASPLRLAAIANWIEVSAEALATSHPEGVIEEVQVLVFQQLVDAGVPEAIAARDVVQDANVASAWRDVLTETLEGAASVGALGVMSRDVVSATRP